MNEKDFFIPLSTLLSVILFTIGIAFFIGYATGFDLETSVVYEDCETKEDYSVYNENTDKFECVPLELLAHER